MSVNKKEKVKFSQAVKNNSFILKTAFKSAPGLCIMRIIMGVITGLNHGISVLLTSKILNSLEAGMAMITSESTREQRLDAFMPALWSVVIMAAYFLLYQLFYSWHWNLYYPMRKLDFIRRLHKRFFVKAAEIDLSCYDTPDFYNDFVYSMQNSDKSIMKTLDMFSDIIRCLVASISVFGVVVELNPIVACVILGFSVITMILDVVENNIYYKYELESNKVWRKDWYFQRFFSLIDYAKEIRLTRISENMKSEYYKNKDEEKKITVRRQKELLWIQILYSLIHIVEDVFIILFMTVALYRGELQIGGFAIAIVAANKIRNNIPI